MGNKLKTPSDSLTILTDFVFPKESNANNNLFGGELLARMDRASSIAARRHSGGNATTASVIHVRFIKMVSVGSMLTVEAKVSRAFSTSMEVYVDVWIDGHHNSQKKIKVAEGIFTFVAFDKKENPIVVPLLTPMTSLEKQRYDGALVRRQMSLVLAGKLSPKKAYELKALFE